MTRRYSLAQLTALPYAPPQMLQLAEKVGCHATGVRLLPAAPGGKCYPLMTDAAMLRDTLACMQDTGVQILDLEIIRIDQDFAVQDWLAFMETGAKLGAKHILVAGDDTDIPRLTASFAKLCEAAAPFGLTADLEFMPWTAIANVAIARQILEAVAQPNAGILVDALHFARCASTLAELAALPRDCLHYAQICDGTVPAPTSVEDLIFDARCNRLLPGEGGINLRDLFAQLPCDLPISIEIPNDARTREMGFEAWAKQAMQTSRQMLEGE